MNSLRNEESSGRPAMALFQNLKEVKMVALYNAVDLLLFLSW
ncbi:hypothetical protein ACQZV8_01495 [Magnetococcales bacterium HHB-1]